MRKHPVAVIDIGSNSSRVMVFQRDDCNHLRLLAGSRAPLRLVRDVDERAQLSEATMARSMDALRDFRAIAARSGARRIVAVATAALRDAANGAVFAERVHRELNIRIDIIEGLTEARYGFTGAIRGSAASTGLLFDLGGGSLQVTRFAQRRLVNATSLPFGALRVSRKSLTSDPPSRKQLRELRNHVRTQLLKERVGRLAQQDRLVGTGGTLRNLAKIERHMRGYSIGTLHGYELSIDGLDDIVDLLARTREKHRDDIPGLSAGRADSIVGGAVVIQTLARFVGAKHVLVSGHGLREGVALKMLNMLIDSPDAVQEASLSSLMSRFDGWEPQRASRRRGIAATLYQVLEPKPSDSLARAIDCAARVIDIGRTFDVVNRHKHTADILATSELDGFSHAELALTSAIVRRAGDRHADVHPLELVDRAIDQRPLDRAAVVVALADEIEARCPGQDGIAIACRVDRDVTLSAPQLQSWLVKDLDKRFDRAFNRRLIVSHGDTAFR